MLVAGTSVSAQDMRALGNVSSAVKAVDAGRTTAAIGSVLNPAPVSRVAVATAASSVVQAVPANLAQSVATEAAWLYKAGWPLYALVDKYSAGAPLDEQANCLATAVYFEARGESVEGQLAVARVVMNRAASGRYPPDWCSVVKQHAQFSFVRNGEFPAVDPTSASWARAQGVARLAVANVVPSVDPDVLWYHATYVAPSWGRRLSYVEKIGLHVFYRA
jgi:N-acetylmuramoyl-L-alanine amidase